MKNFKFKIHEIVIYKFTNQRKTNKGKKLKADVFKALLILTRQFKGHIWQIFVKKIYSFHFTTKVIKQKMSADTILIKYIYFIFAIFKIGKISTIFNNLLFYDVNLTATVAKFPTFKKKSFFLEKKVP